MIRLFFLRHFVRVLRAGRSAGSVFLTTGTFVGTGFRGAGALLAARTFPVARMLLTTAVLLAGAGPAFCQKAPARYDFSAAKIVAPASPNEVEKAAVSLLTDEIAGRTAIELSAGPEWPEASVPVIVIGTFASLENSTILQDLDRSFVPGREPEGFTVKIAERSEGAPVVVILGNDERGALYGAGYFLRKASLEPGRIEVPAQLDVVTHPVVPLRGHQLGYRPKTNSYDGFDVNMWEQYIRDLVVFGANAVELLPPLTDDESHSPMFPLPAMDMLLEMDRLIAKYGMEAWMWYPLMHGDYSKPANVQRSLRENDSIFSLLPRIDAIFIPGGDPGHTPPEVLFDYLEKEAQVLRKYHPEAEMWVSPQGFDSAWMDEFLALLKEEPGWLTGIVYGPQVRIGLEQLRREVPQRYKIRRYPDITHNYDAQYPVPDWDFAFAATENRESINPRPLQQKMIFNQTGPENYHGFITYSEGVNDDVNKMIWSSLGWNPHADITEILHDYGRYFIGPEYAGPFAQALLDLEKNWEGALLNNRSVYATLLKFQAMERQASPRVRLNWRFQLASFRAYYDAYTRSRLLRETELEEEAMEILRKAPETGSAAAMQKAREVLARASGNGAADEWRQRLFELAEALFQSIRMQKSVEKYFAAGVRRGANLDLWDYPLNNRFWLEERFSAISAMEEEDARLSAIRRIVEWENPGPGGFYDDLGDPENQPHLVNGKAYAEDPAFLSSPFTGYAIGEQTKSWRVSWNRYAQTLYDQPLEMHYSGLDPSARYQVRVTYTRDLYQGRKEIRLMADEALEVHPYIEKPREIQPLTFDIPAEATSDGELRLKWTSEQGQGGTGRGCQIAEVWLMKK